MMITISKSELKSKMLEYFRRIELSGEDIIVTDNRRPVLKVSPLRKKLSPKDVFGDTGKSIKYYEDLMTDTTDEWTER